VHEARARATVVGSDLTLVALDAYLRAALETEAQRPECNLPWWLLAGIGRVESGHGTFATSTLDAAGTARPSIIGIALDGGNDTAVITDTDGGRLDGDRISDRAVGPMQFIPSTWARYEVDGNGDGVADPQNLYDAARAAADYLCTAGGDLSTDAGIQRAVFAYNHSDAYVAKVLSFAQEYVTLLA
jgi:membrane-bound lytic murein transglycosylase B